MTTLQTWLIVGIPALLTVLCLFVGRSQVRAWIGYAVIAATVVTFVTVPGDGLSAGAFGLVAALLVANGRGTHTDAEHPEHHQHRERFTVARR
ncbi:MAG: hypothetical protein ACLGIR_05790 [Actinomycetes bacterium]